MAGFTHFLKSLFIPLFVAAILYVAIAHLIVPFVRRHRSRYSQYLPMSSGVVETTASWRTRISDALFNLFVPASWIQRRFVVDGSNGEHTEDELFDDAEGEGMVGFDPIDDRRREALEQRRSMVGDDERRLSRELEEGFKDASDDEQEEDERRRSLSRPRSAGSFY